MKGKGKIILVVLLIVLIGAGGLYFMKGRKPAVRERELDSPENVSSVDGLNQEAESLIHDSLEEYRTAFKREIYYSPLAVKKEQDRIAALQEDARRKEEEKQRMEEEKKRIAQIKDREERRKQELKRLERLGIITDTNNAAGRGVLVQRLRRHMLKAIVFNGDNKYALIDNEIYEVDQTFDGFLIYHLEEDKVTVKAGEEIFFMKLPGFKQKDTANADIQ